MSQTITIHFIAARAYETGAAGTKDPQNCVSLTVKTGKTVMEAATANDVAGIAADCGGSMTCATCHVIVSDEFVKLLPPPDSEELGMLAFTAAPREANSRLSCQLKLTAELDGLTLRLPANQY